MTHHKSNRQMVGGSATLSVIIWNVHGFKALIKKNRMADIWFNHIVWKF